MKRKKYLVISCMFAAVFVVSSALLITTLNKYRQADILYSSLQDRYVVPILQKIVYYKGPKQRADYDYTLDLNLTGNWEPGDDGCYYFTTPVESGKKTDILINRCEQSENADVPEGCHLSVDIIVQTVQAVGFTDEDNPNGVIPAYKDAWQLP